jgi:N utilization substance protein B
MINKNTELRRKKREEIIQKLYEIDINDGAFDFEMSDEYVNTSVTEVMTYLEKIDEKIKANLTNWTLQRLTFVDRAIIRFATYELTYTQLPSEIVINEALILTKKFSDEGDNKMVGFTNKVLDNIKESLGR